MDGLLERLLIPLDESRRQAIRQRWQTYLRDDAGGSAELDVLADALQDFPEAYPPDWWLDPALSRWWLCLRVDWKAADELEWQIQAIAYTLGVGQPLFISQLVDQPGVSVPDILSEAATWLRRRGYELLQVETGGDEYLAVPVRPDLLAEVLRVAHFLSLSIHLIE